MGLSFQNPIGLAAGLDKNGDYIDALGALGFGFIEVGTITPKPQRGNEKPRLFRLPEINALINRMGFNNKGVDYLVKNLKKRHYQGILGVNIGKNKDTPLDKSVQDYLICLEAVYPYADYVTINISSPNTPGLRQLQSATYFEDLLVQLKNAQRSFHHRFKRYVPLVVKIAPDLTSEEIIVMAELLLKYEIDGVIATNTTIKPLDELILDTHTLPYEKINRVQGGLSGQPLFHLSTTAVETLKSIIKDQIPIIAVGGIMSPADAKQKFDSGASLVQLYTGLVYQGPKLIQDIYNFL